MDPVVLESARRHNVADEDILHAYRNPIKAMLTEDLDTMLIGPSTSAELLEIGVAEADGVVFIFHAMPARPKFLD